ncbi:carbohydrate ABC transporter permease [Paenibacillus eucommiae]|uniref:Aldouronate transport system permease protein n=1 Tax=Paenibacillus eucommiae TaxID=1355755 RepID=A0ABS4J0P6_9BACL|nr:carbohydrate ABC transporter permease [Paenibacillus eucommiae]MBP1993409.1 putative aldouronate transport system permease protein [Paenibacillus eucommiae]
MVNRSMGSKCFDIFNYSFMALFCLTILLPFWDMFILSISDAKLSASLSMRLWPKTFDLSAYYFAFSDNKIPLAYLVTIYRTICGTILSLVLTVIAAYPLSKKDLPLRNVMTTIFLIPMFFGGGLIPTYIIIRKLGLVDNLLVYILPGAVGIFTILIVRNTFMSMDKALEESAFMDGAGYLTILFRIYVPLSKPILATVALWSMVGHWNAWFDALIYIRSEDKMVLQSILQRMVAMTSNFSEEALQFQMQNPGLFVTSQTFQAAVTIVTIGPIVMVYPFFQKYFVKGIMIGSLKG